MPDKKVTINDVVKFSTDMYVFFLKTVNTHEERKRLDESLLRLAEAITENDWDMTGNSIIINDNSPLPSRSDLPVTGITIGDAYFVIDDGNLYVWNGRHWEESGDLRGADGQGITILDPVPSVIDLPVNNQIGDTVFTLDTNELFQWNGTRWINQGSMQGEPFKAMGSLANKAELDAITDMRAGQAYVLEDTGHLWVYLLDDLIGAAEWIDMGQFSGSSFTAKGTLPNKTMLDAITDMAIGDAYALLDTGHLWIYDGAIWVDMGKFIPDSFNAKGMIEDKAALDALTNMKMGDAWVTEDTGHLWVYNELLSPPAWVDMGQTQGWSFQNKGFIRDKDALDALTNMKIGWAYVLEDTKHMWVYSEIEVIDPGTGQPETVQRWIDMGLFNGNSFIAMGMLTNKAALDALTDMEVGQAYVLLDSKHIWIYSQINTLPPAWVDMGQFNADSFLAMGVLDNKAALDAIVDMKLGNAYVLKDTKHIWVYTILNGVLQWVDMGQFNADSFVPKGILDNKAELDLLTGMRTGEAYVLLDTRHMWIYNGDILQWVDMGRFQGYSFIFKGRLANKAALDALTDMEMGDCYVLEDTKHMWAYDDLAAIWRDGGRFEGYSFNAKGRIDDKAALDALTDMKMGDAWILIDTEHLWIYDETKWVDMGKMTGFSFKAKGQLNDKAELDAITDMEEGDAWVLRSDKHIWVYSVDLEWVDMGQFSPDSFIAKGTLPNKAALDALTDMRAGNAWILEDTKHIWVYDDMDKIWVDMGQFNADSFLAMGRLANKAALDAITGMRVGHSYVLEDTRHIWIYTDNAGTLEWRDMGRFEGYSFMVRGVLADRAELNMITGMEPGWAYVLNDSKHIWIYSIIDNVPQWVDMGQFNADSFIAMGRLANKAELDAITGMRVGWSYILEDTSNMWVYTEILGVKQWQDMGRIDGYSFIAKGRLGTEADLALLTDMKVGDAWVIDDTKHMWVYSIRGLVKLWVDMGRFEGHSFIAKGILNDKAALDALTDMEIGDAWILRDTSHMWIYDGTNWVDMGKVEGSSFNAKGTLPDKDALDALTDMVHGDAWILEDTKHIWIYSIDNVWVDMGRFQGYSFNAKGILNDKAALDALTDMEIGDAWVLRTDRHIWIYNTSLEWVDMDKFQGDSFTPRGTVNTEDEIFNIPNPQGGWAYTVIETGDLWMFDGLDFYWISLGKITGDSFIAKGSLTNKAALDAVTGMKVGHSYVLEDTGHIWVYSQVTFDEQLWVDMGQFIGNSFTAKGTLPNKSTLDLITDMKDGWAYVLLDTKEIWVYNEKDGGWINMGQFTPDSFIAKGSLANKAALDAITGMRVGHAYILEDTSHIWIYSQTDVNVFDWVDMGQFNGKSFNARGVLPNKVALDAITDMSIADAFVLEDSAHIWIYNGTEWVDMGLFSGDSFNGKGVKTTYAELLALTDMVHGDAWVVLETGHMYIYNVDDMAWIDMGFVQGFSFMAKGVLPDKAALDAITGQDQGHAYTLNDTKHMWVWDGLAWIDMGRVEGYSFTAKGTIPNKTALDNLTGMMQGDAYSLLDTKHLWVYDGTAWVDMGNMQGTAPAIWVGTQADYDALPSTDPDTFYIIEI